MEIKELEEILEKCWEKETSFDPVNCNSSNIRWGQCAATSLIVNDYFRGEIVCAKAKLPDNREISHYFNHIEGQEVDLTRSQFPEGTIISPGTPRTDKFPTTRGYLLSSDNTRNRYELLKQKVITAIKHKV